MYYGALQMDKFFESQGGSEATQRRNAKINLTVASALDS